MLVKFSVAKSTFPSLGNLSFFFSFVGLAFYRNKKYSLKAFTMSFLSLTSKPKRPVDCIRCERGVGHVQAWKDPQSSCFSSTDVKKAWPGPHLQVWPIRAQPASLESLLGCRYKTSAAGWCNTVLEDTEWSISDGKLIKKAAHVAQKNTFSVKSLNLILVNRWVN